jgi:hypothetical protein
MVNGVRYRLVKNLVKQICETLDVDRVDMAASSEGGLVGGGRQGRRPVRR